MKTTQRGRLAALSLSLGLLTACGGGGGGASTPAVPDPTLSVQLSAAKVRSGEFVQLRAASDTVGLTFSWDFGDGGSAEGQVVEHRFDEVANRTITLSVTTRSGKRVQTTAALEVQAKPEALAARDNEWQAGCNGLHCGATLAGQYGGSGTGVWRYRNGTAATQAIDVDLSGLNPGQALTLVFSNGGKADGLDTPTGGSAERAQAEARDHGEDAAHTHLLRANAQQVEEDLRRRPLDQAASEEPRRRILAAAEIGSTRTWNDLHDDLLAPVAHATTLRATCAAPNGRRLLFWADDGLWNAGQLKQSHLDAMVAGYCGPQGGFARVVGLLGDVWGSNGVNTRPWLIQESATALQDVHIAIVNPPASSTWAGYFYAVNNSLRTRGSRYVHSNEALVFFVSGPGMARNPAFYLSTLVHELTHMVNYYQRTTVRGVLHDTWLEESSAMMSEDLVAEGISPGYNKIVEVRLPNYVRAANNSLRAWDEANGDANYAMGGSLSAFLNRRFGPSIATALVNDCSSGAARSDSHACLDGILRARGSTLELEWERLGATVFGGMPARHAPFGYGYPKAQFGDVVLAAADTAAMAPQRAVDGMGGATAFKAISHRFVSDTVTSPHYLRRGVRLPAGATLTVVVR